MFLHFVEASTAGKRQNADILYRPPAYIRILSLLRLKYNVYIEESGGIN